MQFIFHPIYDRSEEILHFRTVESNSHNLEAYEFDPLSIQ